MYNLGFQLLSVCILMYISSSFLNVLLNQPVIRVYSMAVFNVLSALFLCICHFLNLDQSSQFKFIY